MKLTLVAVAFGVLAAPVFAGGMDAKTMTCKDLMAMDSKGMMDAGMAINTAMKADPKMPKMTDDATMKAAETACKAHGDGTVVDAMMKK